MNVTEYGFCPQGIQTSWGTQTLNDAMIRAACDEASTGHGEGVVRTAAARVLGCVLEWEQYTLVSQTVSSLGGGEV